MNYDNTAQYTQAKNYIYGRSAAQRITGLEVKETRLYKNTVLVIFQKGQGARPRFIAKDTFKRHFAEYRKQGASQVFVSYKPFSGNFRAPSSQNIQDSYSIELFPDHLECSYADWKTQEEIGLGALSDAEQVPLGSHPCVNTLMPCCFISVAQI